MSIDALHSLLSRGVSEVIVKGELENKLKEGKKLRIKFGVDPTKPDIHLGHTAVLLKLKKFQEDGHTVIFLIGDYTTKIGDPSGRNSIRPMLSNEEIKTNAETYFKQVGKILDTEKTEIRYNSEWFAKMDPAEIFKITSKFTVQQVIERDDFQKRLKSGSDIALHELFYPVMQAYDSIQLHSDVEIGGTDQKFNMLAGRNLQKKMGETQQDIITIKLLVGTDGKEKMSKSLGNYIAITDAPGDMFGKIMSIPDSLIMDYYELCTEISDDELKNIESKISSNPRDTKAELAKIIVAMYHSKDDAGKAAGEFDRVFKNRERPSEMPEIKIKLSECKLEELLVKCELAASKSEARRLIEQGAVEIDGKKIIVPEESIQIKDEMIVQVGKRRFVKIKK